MVTKYLQLTISIWRFYWTRFSIVLVTVYCKRKGIQDVIEDLPINSIIRPTECFACRFNIHSEWVYIFVKIMATLLNMYELPLIVDQLDRLEKCHYLTFFDMTLWFLQIPIHEKSCSWKIIRNSCSSIL